MVANPRYFMEPWVITAISLEESSFDDIKYFFEVTQSHSDMRFEVSVGARPAPDLRAGIKVSEFWRDENGVEYPEVSVVAQPDGFLVLGHPAWSGSPPVGQAPGGTYRVKSWPREIESFYVEVFRESRYPNLWLAKNPLPGNFPSAPL